MGDGFREVHMPYVQKRDLLNALQKFVREHFQEKPR
jgi:hypothetical protein